MANPLPTSVQRLRYFDGEYLRSYDFTDEQSYHIAMRRLMNQKLHLSGIVEGLEIVEDATSTSGATFYSISPGMAIDQTGREIVVPAPYSLSNLLTGPGLVTGPNEVWICYQENETTLPAAGYLDCNVKNQYTRWQETFSLQFQPLNGPSLFIDCGGIRLGRVTLSHSSATGWAISNPTPWGRRYVGIRAQEIIAPDKKDAEADHFDMTVTTTATSPLTAPTPFPPAGYLRIRPSSVEHGNLFVEKNVAIGTNFSIDTTDNSITISPPGDGNLIVSNDLFVQGNFYGYNPNAPNPKGSGPNGAWWDLQQYIQSMMPDVQVGTWQIPVTPCNDSNGTYTTSVQTFASQTVQTAKSSKVTNPSQVNVMVAISSLGCTDMNDLENNWLTSGLNPAALFIQVSASASAANPSNVTVNWTIGPVLPAGGGNYTPPFTTLFVSYVVIFLP